MRVVLAVLMLALFAASASASCSFSKGVVYPIDDAIKCLDSIPPNELHKQATLDSMEKAFPLYTFLDMASSPPPSPLALDNVDIMAELSRFRSTKYDNEFAFQRDVADTFRKLRDAHTNYRMCTPFNRWTFLHPIVIASHVEKEKQVLTVAPYMFPDAFKAQIEKFIGYDLMDFQNAVIHTINQKPALQVITDFARNDVGVAKDVSGRFNLATIMFLPRPGTSGPDLSGVPGYFTARDGYSSTIPYGENTIEFGFTFPNGTSSSYKFPWFAVPKIDLNIDEFANGGELPNNSGFHFKHNKGLHRFAPTKQPDILREIAEESIALKPVHTARTPSKKMSIKRASRGACAGDDCFELLAESDDVQGYAIKSSPRTAVLQINTFGPADAKKFGQAISDVLDKVIIFFFSLVVFPLSLFPISLFTPLPLSFTFFSLSLLISSI